MANYFYSLPEDLQTTILNMKTKINILDNFKMMMQKKKHFKQLQFCLYEINDEYRVDYPCYYYKNISLFRSPEIKERYNDFKEIYDDDDKSVDGFSDSLLYHVEKINALKNKYPKIIIQDLFNCIADFDLTEAKQIERIRKFLYLIS